MAGTLKYWDGEQWVYLDQGPAGPEGPEGPEGPAGPEGPTGADGDGIPALGSPSQVLRVSESSDDRVPRLGDGTFTAVGGGDSAIMFGHADAGSSMSVGFYFPQQSYEYPPDSGNFYNYGPYSFGKGSLVGGRSGFDETSGSNGKIRAFTDGSFAFGYALGGSIYAGVHSGSPGTMVVGNATSGGIVETNGAGSFTSGSATEGGTMNNRSMGGIMFGSVNGAGAEMANARSGSLTGGFAFTNANYTGQLAKIDNTGDSSFAMGEIRVNGNNSSGVIQTDNRNGFAFGSVAVSGDNQQSYIKTTYCGFAFGNATNGGKILASANGSIAGGISSYANGMIRATGMGSMAWGRASNGTIQATGTGSFAFGYASYGGTVEATGAGAFAFGGGFAGSPTSAGQGAAQFFNGTNTLISSLRVGNGIRLRGIKQTSPSSDLSDGDIWLGADNQIRIRTNGVTKIL